MKKRGISPLIATVLIIALVFIVSIVVIIFINTSIEEEILNVEEKEEISDICINKIDLEYRIKCNMTDWFNISVSNSKSYSINGIVVKINSEDGSEVERTIKDIPGYSSNTIIGNFTGILEEIKDIKAAPIIMINEKEAFCPEQKIKLRSNIPDCV
jgi:hypothetical protein